MVFDYAMRSWVMASDVNLEVPERLSLIATVGAEKAQGLLNGVVPAALVFVANAMAFRGPSDVIDSDFFRRERAQAPGALVGDDQGWYQQAAPMHCASVRRQRGSRWEAEPAGPAFALQQAGRAPLVLLGSRRDFPVAGEGLLDGCF